ncbi:MAG: hypothetical protein K0S61_128 [Anaerocolumna sp.]|jgi:hypothetical protein|nr:hypothetical protein [Anaerocolumna sp.]
MISISQKGNFDKTDKFFKNIASSDYVRILDRYGQEGVSALRSATPMDSGKTANSWGYKINFTKGGASITWTNSNIVNGVPIAIIIQYGHVSRNGGYVSGKDYINPALQPIFDKIANELWREVTKL